MVSGWEGKYFPEPDVSDLLQSSVRGGDMPPAVLEGFSQVASPAHAVAGQGDHGDQQGGDRGAGVGGGGLGVGGLPCGRGAGRGRGRGGAGGHQNGEGAVGRGSCADQDHHGKRGGPHGQKGAKRRGEVEQERWKFAWEMSKQGRVEDVPDDIQFRYYNTVLKVASRYQKSPPELEKLDNTWIWGPSGSGKSTYVHKRYPGHYKKGFTKWWDGFRVEDEAHQTVILDDLHPKWSLKEELKNWADKFPFPAEYKGGVMIIRPARIVITSNYPPEQVSNITIFYFQWRVSATT